MPKVIDGNSQTPNEYYIYKGERKKSNLEFDAAWIGKIARI